MSRPGMIPLSPAGSADLVVGSVRFALFAGIGVVDIALFTPLDTLSDGNKVGDIEGAATAGCTAGAALAVAGDLRGAALVLTFATVPVDPVCAEVLADREGATASTVARGLLRNELLAGVAGVALPLTTAGGSG